MFFVWLNTKLQIYEKLLDFGKIFFVAGGICNKKGRDENLPPLVL